MLARYLSLYFGVCRNLPIDVWEMVRKVAQLEIDDGSSGSPSAGYDASCAF
jgi:hypothetical protein